LVAACSPGRAFWLYGEWVRTGFVPDHRRPQSRVAILHEDSYTGPLDRTLIEGIRLFDLNLRGKTVLLKPNLVEYIPGAEVNTNPRLVGAAASAFLALGAKTVLVGEGPGRQRDTVLVLDEADWKQNFGKGASGLLT
jgi:hypothetical protein